MSQSDLILVTAEGCRRSKTLVTFLKERAIPFIEVPVASEEGRALVARHDIRSSPGILINGRVISPFDVLIPGQCRVDEASLMRLLERG
ncbi:MAG: hypothetical protein Kow0077_03050 [Anaerolineae bacterium]